MTWHEIRQMQTAGVEFAAHTLSHLDLDRCDLAIADAEICGSKARIEDALGRTPDFFAYPYGKQSQSIREIVARAGFAAAFTTNVGLVQAGDDPFRLNRIDFHDAVAPSLPYFACRVARFMNLF
jgi:peptidoglycan/xylan/chitin deacetylase (PgdA/CDA1 family)